MPTETTRRARRRQPKVVVGVDGSEGSKLAFSWALEEGALRQATVVVVYAWHFPYAGRLSLQLPNARDQLEQAGTTVLEGLLKDVRGRRSSPSVETRVVQGNAASVLAEEARDADLLVVGSRGLGGFSGLLLGSVSAQLAHHAPCPVVIVPTAPEGRTKAEPRPARDAGSAGKSRRSPRPPLSRRR